MILKPSTAMFFLAVTLGVVSETYAHRASRDWTYPPGCCRGTEVGGDCVALPSEDVKPGRDGFSISVHPGDHPIVTKRQLFFIPYGRERPSGDGSYHICLNPTENDLNCFFAPPGNS